MLETFLSGGSFTDVLAEVELPHRRRRAGQGPRRADRHDQETLAAIHQTVSRHRGRTPTSCACQTAAQKVELDNELKELKAAKAELKPPRERDASATSRIQRATLRQARPQQEATSPRRSPAAAKAQQPARREDHGPRRASSPSRATSRRSTTARCAGRWPGNVTQNFGCTGFAGSRRSAAAPTSTRASTSSAPYGTAGPRRRATASSPTSAGTTPTAPTRPGS